MASGKHASNQEFDFNIPWKKILIAIIIIAVLIGIIFGGKAVYSSFLANRNLFSKEKEEPEEVIVEEKMPTELNGYKVLGELIIENKNYSCYILEADEEDENLIQSEEITTDENTENVYSIDSSENTENESSKMLDALKNGVVKLYGDKLNQKGNFTIIGHNEDKYFAILNELNVGDEFFIKTVSEVEKKYIITDKYTIDPTDLKALMPSDYIEVTLITCATGSNQRLVIKALEESDYEISKAENIESENTDQTNSTEEVIENTTE